MYFTYLNFSVIRTKFFCLHRGVRISEDALYVASGIDRHSDITFGLHVVDSSSLVSILLEKRLAIPTSPFFSFTSEYFSVL